MGDQAGRTCFGGGKLKSGNRLNPRSGNLVTGCHQPGKTFRRNCRKFIRERQEIKTAFPGGVCEVGYRFLHRVLRRSRPDQSTVPDFLFRLERYAECGGVEVCAQLFRAHLRCAFFKEPEFGKQGEIARTAFATAEIERQASGLSCFFWQGNDFESRPLGKIIAGQRNGFEKFFPAFRIDPSNFQIACPFLLGAPDKQSELVCAFRVKMVEPVAETFAVGGTARGGGRVENVQPGSPDWPASIRIRQYAAAAAFPVEGIRDSSGVNVGEHAEPFRQECLKYLIVPFATALDYRQIAGFRHRYRLLHRCGGGLAASARGFAIHN